jgi:tRNA-dihydrouridine synthase B
MAEISTPAFSVGPIPVPGHLILAPMDGITDLPFRVLLRRLGSAMSYTEFVNAKDVIYWHPHLAERLQFLEEERPVVIQIYDDNPDRMLKAALILEKLHPDIIDVNMGCPAKTVSNRGAGAGLLKEPKKVAEIIQKLTANLSVPVTAKIRLGWDDKSRNYLEIAHIIEDNGARLLAVHGRTRVQNYSGQADWDAIAEVKQAIHTIPVIGNGDVTTVADIQRIVQYTGCDGVMIGRGAISNPWIFSGLDREQVSPELVYQTIMDHLKTSLDFYGNRGLILFRKFAKRYLKTYAIAPEIMQSMMTCEDPRQFFDLVNDTFQRFSFFTS